MSRQIVVRIAVRGTVLDGCPGLAITRDADGGAFFSVTHIASGRQILVRLSRSQARRRVRDLVATGVDWTLDDPAPMVTREMHGQIDAWQMRAAGWSR